MAQRLRGHPTAPLLARGFSAARKPRAGALQHAHRLADFGFADDQRRQQTHDVVAGRDREQLLLAQRLDQLAIRHDAAHAEQQALAAHLGDHARKAVLDLGEALLEQQPESA